MLSLFAVGMTLEEGVKSPFDYSVYTASAASFLLAAYHESSLSLDALMKPGSPAIEGFSRGEAVAGAER